MYKFHKTPYGLKQTPKAWNKKIDSYLVELGLIDNGIRFRQDADNKETRFHFLREKVNRGELEVRHCSSETQLADIFTKGLKTDKFLNLRRNLGIVQIEVG